MTGSPELTNDEIQNAVDALCIALDLQNDATGETVSTLREILDERVPGCEKNFLALKHDDVSVEMELPDEELPGFAVSLFGTELFEGKHGKRLRDLILDKRFERDPRFILRFLPPSTDASDLTDEKLEKHLGSVKKRHWVSGGRTAKEFARIMGFSIKFAGTILEKKPENVENIERRMLLGKLFPFQANLKEQMLSLLQKVGGSENRGILRLPTGSGKTRIAVEAIIEFWKKRGQTARFVIWVAQKDELCEQAFQSFKQVWEEQGTEGDILSIYRVWGGRSLPGIVDEGIIVAGISQLNSLISESEDNDEDDNELSRIRHLVGALIIDEAHGSTTTMYSRVLNSLEIRINTDDSKQIPLIGITATPYRSSDYQTSLLLRQYNRNVLWPNPLFRPDEGFNDDWRDYDFVLDRLTKDEVLAVPNFYYLDSGQVFSMDEKESETLEKRHVLSDALLSRVGQDPNRNIMVYKVIREWAAKGRNILFFGASVNQAVMMKEFLNQNGIKSAVITGDTEFGSRHRYVKMFKEKKIQVLCNYNILTTGFDSPKVDTIIIARPTESRLLYEQMVGRGLRGPRFGGTPKCDIITVLDNILNYDRKRIKQGHEEFAETLKGLSEQEIERLTEIKSGFEEFEQEFKPIIPVAGEEFTNDDIQRRFLVQNQGRIRFTDKHHFVILVDSDMDGCQDRVGKESGTIIYAGTGEEDQGFDHGSGKPNSKVRDPKSTLLFFQRHERNKIIFKYPVKYESYSFETEENAEGKERRVINFSLKIIKKSCPNCNETIASNETEIEELFGYRTSNRKRIQQSWCKECRNI